MAFLNRFITLFGDMSMTPTREPQTHDYTHRGWGHDYAIMCVRNDGHELDMMGWGYGIAVGDYLILSGRDPGETTRYQVRTIEYSSDPKDMWSIVADFAPRGEKTTP